MGIRSKAGIRRTATAWGTCRGSGLPILPWTQPYGGHFAAVPQRNSRWFPISRASTIEAHQKGIGFEDFADSVCKILLRRQLSMLRRVTLKKHLDCGMRARVDTAYGAKWQFQNSSFRGPMLRPNENWGSAPTWFSVRLRKTNRNRDSEEIFSLQLTKRASQPSELTAACSPPQSADLKCSMFSTDPGGTPCATEILIKGTQLARRPVGRRFGRRDHKAY